MEKSKEAAVQRNHKDSLFCDLFSDKQNALSLYNAINGTAYDKPDDLQVVTLKDVIFLHQKNDVSVLFDAKLTLWEHQSSYNPNMPIRGLQYFSRSIEGMLGDDRKLIYRRSLWKMPTPAYYVLYNGTEEMPEKKDLKLSDAFLIPTEGYEWTAHMININAGQNAEILDRCPTLKGYAMLIQYTRDFHQCGDSTETAIDKAVKKCIEEGYLSEYLTTIRGEAKYMLITEFDEKAWEEAVREDGREEGREEGRKYTLVELICRKLRKGKKPLQIADELEEDEARIRTICDTAQTFAPDYDANKVFDALHTSVLQQ